MKIAKGHQGVMPYLIVKNANEFIHFAKTVFNAMVVYKSFRNESSGEIAHAEISINDCNIMLADVTEDFDVANANLFVYVEDADATFHLALESDAEIVSNLADQGYGRSGGIRDPFGNVWWITSLK
jgi:PhnB protein